MTGLSDLAQKATSNPSDVAKEVTKSSLTGGLGNIKEKKENWKVLSGSKQKSEQLQRATDANAAAKAANDAQIASDAAAAEQKRRAGIMPVADDAAAKADKRRRAAAASAGGREGTILSGQRLGD